MNIGSLNKPQSLLLPLQYPNTVVYADSRLPQGNDTLLANDTSMSVQAGLAGINLTQGTAAKQPVFKTDIRNGLPVVRFDGIQQSFQVSGLHTRFTNSCTFIFVINPTTISGGRWLLDTDGGTRLIFLISGYDATGIGASITPITGWQILSFVMDGSAGTGKVYRNGTLLASNAYTARSFGATTGLFADAGGTTGRFQGDCGAVVGLNSALSDADHLALVRGLGNVWGIATA